MSQTQSPLDWLIIGGGIHGVHLAVRLLDECRTSAERVRILDPAPRLLSQWRARTAATGMSHLRSPSVHHLDLSPSSLQQFVGRRKFSQPSLFAPPYHQPALELFNDHCDWVIDKYSLSSLHLNALASDIILDGGDVIVETKDGRSFCAKNIILAMGLEVSPIGHDWSHLTHQQVQHIFDPNLSLSEIHSTEPVAVLGGGISAGQIALRLAGNGHPVHLISRHPLREHQFDSSPGWLGPKYMMGFERERSLGRRRTMITEARYRGSVPPAVRQALLKAISSGAIKRHESEVRSSEASDNYVCLTLGDGSTVEVKKLVLATGLQTTRPGGQLLDTLIARYQLSCSACGFPMTNKHLQWHPNIWVTGALAELEVGPVARNIAGARRAADRILASKACRN